MADEFHAVHPRHVEVAHDDVDRGIDLLVDIERGLPVGGGEDETRAQAAQHVGGHPALEALVLDDEEAKIREARSAFGAHARLRKIRGN